MFRPITELARIDALQPVVNAFVDVDHEGARAAADAIAPGDERPFAAYRSRSRTTAPCAGCG